MRYILSQIVPILSLLRGLVKEDADSLSGKDAVNSIESILASGGRGIIDSGSGTALQQTKDATEGRERDVKVLGSAFMSTYIVQSMWKERQNVFREVEDAEGTHTSEQSLPSSSDEDRATKENDTQRGCRDEQREADPDTGAVKERDDVEMENNGSIVESLPEWLRRAVLITVLEGPSTKESAMKTGSSDEDEQMQDTDGESEGGNGADRPPHCVGGGQGDGITVLDYLRWECRTKHDNELVTENAYAFVYALAACIGGSTRESLQNDEQKMLLSLGCE